MRASAEEPPLDGFEAEPEELLAAASPVLDVEVVLALLLEPESEPEDPGM
jgi:hypothetical protein